MLNPVHKAYQFLIDKEGKNFYLEELSKETGWAVSTIKTYISKKWKPYLKKINQNFYQVNNIDSLTFDDFLTLQSQVNKNSSVLDETDGNVCCVECFNSAGIKAYISSQQKVGNCSYCLQRRKYIISVKQLGQWIFSRLPYIPLSVFTDEEKSKLKSSNAVELNTIFQNIELFNLKDKTVAINLAQELIPPGGHYVENDSTWLNGVFEPVISIRDNKDAHFMWNRVKKTPLFVAWNQFKGQVKKIGRFFDFNPKASRLQKLEALNPLFEELKQNLPKGTIVYRARKIDKSFLKELSQAQNKKEFLNSQLGPPPSNKYKPNRMNPPGIPYLYISEDEETCISEVMPEVGDTIAIAKFMLLEDLNIIDLMAPTKGLPGEFLKKYMDFDKKDIFDPLYWAFDFLVSFTFEISSIPTNSAKEISYIPTQVISEYIRLKGYDGFKYSSMQKPSSDKSCNNFTLFCGSYSNSLFSSLFDPENDFDTSHKKIPSFHKWLNLENVKYIEIESISYTPTNSYLAELYLEDSRLLDYV